jgi:hypothetical protein
VRLEQSNTCAQGQGLLAVRLSDSIRQRTSAYVSIRQHTYQHTSAYIPVRRARGCSPCASGLAYVSIRQHTRAYGCSPCASGLAYVSIRQHTSAYIPAYVSMHTRAQGQGLLAVRLRASIRQHTSAYVSIRQHTYQHTSAYIPVRRARGCSPCASVSAEAPKPLPCPYLVTCWSAGTGEGPSTCAEATSEGAYGIRQHTSLVGALARGRARQPAPRQRQRGHTAYVSIRQHTRTEDCSWCQRGHTSYVSIRRHTRQRGIRHT